MQDFSLFISWRTSIPLVPSVSHFFRQHACQGMRAHLPANDTSLLFAFHLCFVLGQQRFALARETFSYCPSTTAVTFQKHFGTLPWWQPVITVAASQPEMFLLQCISPLELLHRVFPFPLVCFGHIRSCQPFPKNLSSFPTSGEGLNKHLLGKNLMGKT